MVVKLPRITPWFFSLSIPIWFKKFRFDGEHYWEVGAKGYSNRAIKNILSRYFFLVSSARAKGNPYHIFYELKIN